MMHARNGERGGGEYLQEDPQALPEDRGQSEDTRSPIERFFGFGEPARNRQGSRPAQPSKSMGQERQMALEKVFGTQFPALNISDNEKEVRVSLDVEGIDANNINIEVAGNWMAINGWMETVVAEDEEARAFERTFRAFRREVTLPAEVREDEVEATYDGKQLNVIAPKVSRVSQSRIRVERRSEKRS